MEAIGIIAGVLVVVGAFLFAFREPARRGKSRLIPRPHAYPWQGSESGRW